MKTHIRASFHSRDWINNIAINENKSQAEVVSDLIEYVENKRKYNFYGKITPKPLKGKRVRRLVNKK